MNEAQADGYFSACDYVHGYHREISPVFQRFCLLLRGLACADPGEAAATANSALVRVFQSTFMQPPTLGNTLALTSTRSTPEHARSLAGQTGGNTRLYDDSFAQLLDRSNLPEFDSISLPESGPG